MSVPRSRGMQTNKRSQGFRSPPEDQSRSNQTHFIVWQKSAIGWTMGTIWEEPRGPIWSAKHLYIMISSLDGYRGPSSPHPSIMSYTCFANEKVDASSSSICVSSRSHWSTQGLLHGVIGRGPSSVMSRTRISQMY